jgi:hypothetical protein
MKVYVKFGRMIDYKWVYVFSMNFFNVLIFQHTDVANLLRLCSKYI